MLAADKSHSPPQVALRRRACSRFSRTEMQRRSTAGGRCEATIGNVVNETQAATSDAVEAR